MPPPVYITGIKVFGESQPLSAPLRLKYNRNYLDFSFIGVSFTSPEDVTYKHRLVGIDPDWFETGNPSVSYPYLPPGTYTFKVIARNNDGIESIKPADFKFRILPPFWQTWWFRGLLLVTLLSILAMIVMWRIKRLKEKMADEARNKQLIMAQKMELVGILAGGAVHDLKNLLSIIIGYSKIAVQQIDHEDTKSKPLEKIKTTAMTAVSVVKQILAFTRQKYDQTIAANLPNLLDEILEILKISTPPEIKINWQPPQEEIRLYINPTKFQQVVMNLCLNAVQAIPAQGEIDISMQKDRSKHIILEIADNGMGMAQEVAAKIFDPLFTTKEPGKGTGLGLFVVKQIVDEQKGKIEVKSKPGEGTVFKIYFPCRESA
jgi:signal transduction histidine kinase